MRFTKSRGSAARIVLIYALFGALWILFSDRLLLATGNAETMLLLSTAKGWLYVAVTATLLYALIADELRRRQILEAELRARVEEKEALLKEIHHRVKNNLQIVSSMLSLERDRLPAETTRDLVDELRARIGSMAMVHERLYLSGDLAKIDLSTYLRDLGSEVAGIFGLRESLSFTLDALSVGIDTAMPCGLVAAEALANAARYGRGGDMRLSLRTISPDEAELEIRDAGPGFPALPGQNGIGFMLMGALAAQLGGEFKTFNDEGAVVRLRFPLAGGGKAKAGPSPTPTGAPRPRE